MSNRSTEQQKLAHAAAHLKWVPMPQMKTPPLAQRELNRARVDHLVANLDLEQIGTPTVSHRDGTYWIIDGQHRIEALRNFGLADEALQVWVYENLSETDEAEMFLKLNDVLPVSAFEKFTKCVHAGRPVECDINRIVRAQNLVVSRDHIPGAIHAVGTLVRAYNQAGGPNLGRCLRLIRDAYGDAGFEASVIDGIARVTARYDTGVLDEVRAVEKLSNAHAGVKGLLNLAEQMRAETGNPKGQCVAAAAMAIYNRGLRGRQSLGSWWKDEADN